MKTCFSGEREARNEILFNGYRPSVWVMKKFWRWIVMVIAQQCESQLCKSQLHNSEYLLLLKEYYCNYILQND